MARCFAALCYLLACPALLAGQSDSTRVGLRLDFGQPPLSLRPPPALRAPWLGGPRVPPALMQAAWDSTVARALDSTAAEGVVARRLAAVYRTPLLVVAEEGFEEGAGRAKGLFGLPQKYADVSIDGQARLEIETDRFRNERCLPIELQDPNSGCTGGFKAPRLTNEFNLRSSGVIGRRLFVNVDYDSQRDFGGNNEIQAYYQGLEDEIVQRVEVGTVTFRPPTSRFITTQIPSNNFGVNATFELGAFRFQALAAQQKGSVVGDRVYTVGQTTAQTQDRLARDRDFEANRFFWVLDPTTLPGYPAIDILNLTGVTLSPALRPRELRVYRYQQLVSGGTINPNLGGINAAALAADGTQPVTGRWQLLVRGVDYYLDPSGFWFALAGRAGPNDHLAVSYVTQTGDTVGTYPQQDNTGNGAVPRDTLVLILQPLVAPTAFTFRYEMRQVYRIAGSDLQRGSLQVDLTVNQSERPQQGTAPTYLALLGLATASDPNIFDSDNRLFPRIRDPGAAQTLSESYVVFPNLQPFADATRLAPAELSDSLYRTPLYLLPTEGPVAKFQFRFRYTASGGGDRSTLNLNALQIREGSEQLVVQGRSLQRDIDYTISYDLGQVTFLNPDALFPPGTSTQVTARFEEHGIFAVAPTSIYGFSTRYSLGDRGAINLLGIYQSEQSVFTRPALGFEPSANLVGGVNTELHFKPGVITRLMNGLASGGTTTPSALDLNAEFAFTRPDVNRAGQAYLEEFEGPAGFQVSLRENAWQYGGRPRQADGLDIPEFATGFDSTWAVQLTWQNLVFSDVLGSAVALRARDIDPQIRIVGEGDALETVLWLALQPDTAGGVVRRDDGRLRWTMPKLPNTPRWRSTVTALSSRGLDLSNTEYLEFWVFQPGDRTADSLGMRLLFDLGKVSEDALALAPESLFVAGGDTTYRGRQYVGGGRLDTERTATGLFNAETDDNGILGDRPDRLFAGTQPLDSLAICRSELSEVVRLFHWGDLSSRCSNGNGLLDTEDLDADQQLDATGAADDVLRWVVRLDDPKYFVRNGTQTLDDQGRPAGWKLYRVPIGRPDATIGTPNLRLIQDLRITAATPPDNGGSDPKVFFAFARMRFVGSPWVRRAATPIRGLAGALGEPVGEVVASVVSTENSELGYTSPPGIVNQGSRQDGGGDAGTQINETSLRILAVGLGLNQRAEAYLRFPGGPQNLLKYGTLRVWARGRPGNTGNPSGAAGWDAGDLQAFVKLGSDDRNFYLYKSPARSTGWDPEMIIDLETWRRLRAELESRYLRGDRPDSLGAIACASDSTGTAYVACEGNYVVFLGSPGVTPPNLAAVQELSAGVIRVNQAVAFDTAEVWIDDVRLDNPVSRVGTAVALTGQLALADVASLNLAYTRQDGTFQQFGQDPTYRTTGTVQVNSAWRLDRFLPASLGLSVPATATYTRSSVDPELLTGTDVRGDRLVGLRKPEARSTAFSIAIRRSRRGSDWITRGFVDPLAFSANFTQGRSQTELSEASAGSSSYALVYSLPLSRRGPALPFDWLLGGLPRWLRNSEAAKGLQRPMFSLVPSNIQWSSSLNWNLAELNSFQVPVSRASDSLLRPVNSLSYLWRNGAGLTWQPLGMVTLGTDLQSTRDLRNYSDTSLIGRVAGAVRRSLLGLDVGVERDRSLGTTFGLTPRIASWLRPRFLSSSSFILSRSLSGRDPIRAIDDSAGAFILPQTLNNTRSNELGATLDLGRLLAGILGDSTSARLASRWQPVDISRRLSRSSVYDLAAFDPGLGYMLALGGQRNFLNQEGERALSLSEIRSTTIGSGADLPLGFTFTLSYGTSRSLSISRLGDGGARIISETRDWPQGTVRWSTLLAKGPLASIGVGTSVRRRESDTFQPSPSGIDVVQNRTLSKALTPDLQLTFRNGVLVNVTYSSTDQESLDDGSTTRMAQDDITGSAAYAFRLPRSISRQRKQVRASLNLLNSVASTCLQQPFESKCTDVSNTLRREIRGGLDSDVLDIVTAGLQFGYSLTDLRSGFRRRFSQITLSAVFTLSLFAGDYR